jgi:omega-6 fatty acid desaturase (delta-12 desaturase)
LNGGDVEVAAAAPGRVETEILMATKPFTTERRGRSWFDVLSTFAVLAGLIALSAWPLAWYGRLGAGFLAALVTVRAFVLYHDYQHGAILRRSRVARWLMSFYGMLTLSPPSPWNRSHNHHHQTNAQILGAAIGSYPVMTRAAYARAGRARRLGYRIARNPLTILFGYVTVFGFGMTLRPLLLDPRKNLDCAGALLIQAGLVGVLAWFDPATLFYAHLFPLSVASAFGAYLFYAQHNFPGVKLRDRSEWTYVSASIESTSVMKLSPVLAWVTADIGIHPAHHLNPRIPHYRLQEAFDAIPELHAAGTTGLSVREIRECLRLKLWDPEEGRMVTFAGRP